MNLLILAFALLGCAHDLGRTYSYCAANQIERSLVHDQHVWTAHCDNGSYVVFVSSVNAGDQIYYSPYWENDDPVTEHGYIKRIYEPK